MAINLIQYSNFKEIMQSLTYGINMIQLKSPTPDEASDWVGSGVRVRDGGAGGDRPHKYIKESIGCKYLLTPYAKFARSDKIESQ